MKQSQDHFSKQSGLYAKFRPVYPQALYDWLLGLVVSPQHAWDCGTGNGQVAFELAKAFKQVNATDISQKQLDKAPKVPNIQYQVARGEASPFEDRTFDLICVAQAIHWFDFEAFYAEVARVIKPKGVLAVWGYSLLRIQPAIDELLDHYYTHIIGPYWAPERKHVDTHYQHIQFPLQEISPPNGFAIETSWDLAQFEGYLRTWSSLQSYLEVQSANPVDTLIDQIQKKKLWEGVLPVKFPIFTKVGAY